MSIDIAKARALCAASRDQFGNLHLTVDGALDALIFLREALDEITRLRKALADRAIMLPRCPDCGAYVGPQPP